MDPVHKSLLIFPSWAGASSANVTFYKRENQDTGSWTAFSADPAIPSLTFSFPSGHTQATTVQALIDAVIGYLLRCGISTWWSPPNGMPVETALRETFAEWVPPASNGNYYFVVYFNGQFGPALLSRS